MDDASGCQNDVREVVCMWRDVMWESQFGIPRREEDLKGSRRELDRLAIFLRCVPSVAKVATRVVFFKQNVRRALRGAKDKNSRRGGEGRWDLYICWHGSASTSINRGLDDRWSRRFLAMATTISLSLCPRFIVTVMIIRLFADKLSFLATVWKNKFYRIFRICWVEIFWTRAKTKQISEILRIRKEGIRFISNRYPINLVVPWKKSVEGREKKYNRNIRLETCDIFSRGTTNIPKGKQKLSKQTFPIFPTYS